MRIVVKALWFVESNLANNLSLDGISGACAVSRYHLCRAFGAATGISLMRYVRGRRLTEAARALASGAPSVIDVALSAGYGSHAAFTRAFIDQFGVSPTQVRTAGHLECIQLVEAMKMTEKQNVQVQPPRFESAEAFTVAGLSERYTFDTNQGIPALWQRFAPHIGQIPGQIGSVTYGVCCNGDDQGHFDYIAGVQVSGSPGLPAEFGQIEIPAHRYAVFSHNGHVASLRDTVDYIWNQWLPQSKYSAARTPDFERYDDRFNPQTGAGLIEIWLPVEEE